jgi:hypothetical protein
MDFPLYQDVILTENLPADGLCAGDVGTLVERHVVPGQEDGYSVEFFDMTGRTVAVVTVPAHKLRLPTPGDRPAARTMAKASA